MGDPTQDLEAWAIAAIDQRRIEIEDLQRFISILRRYKPEVGDKLPRVPFRQTGKRYRDWPEWILSIWPDSGMWLSVGNVRDSILRAGRACHTQTVIRYLQELVNRGSLEVAEDGRRLMFRRIPPFLKVLE